MVHQCPICISTCVRRIVTEKFAYGPITVVVKVPVHKCNRCGLEFTDDEKECIEDATIAAEQRKLREHQTGQRQVGAMAGFQNKGLVGSSSAMGSNS